MKAIVTYSRNPLNRLIIFAVLGALIMGAFLWLGFQGKTGPNLNPQNWRSITEIDPGFFVALIVGITAYFISIWVWILRPIDAAVILFALSGLATLLFTYAAAIWLFAFPLSPKTQQLAAIVNFMAASAFGTLIISLFLIYPRRLPHYQLMMIAITVIFGGWTLLSIFGPTQNLNAVHTITFFEMLLIIVLIACQIILNWKDPKLRAISVWFGSTVLIGAGIFIATIAGPQTFGYANLIYVYYAFGSFILIYVGLAFGLMRYRIFDLGRWSFHLLSYLIVLIFIVLIDFALVQFLAINSTAAISIASLIVIISYLPIRNLIWQYFSLQPKPDQSTVFKAVLNAAFTTDEKQIPGNWKSLFETLFNPLEIVETSQAQAVPRLQDNGLSLMIPPFANRPGYILKHAGNGTRLFSKKDLLLATQALTLMKSADTSRREYDRGVFEERTRIAQDIHDNIGAQLMQALHSKEPERKNDVIRTTLTDLRDVINNAQGFDIPAYESLADLRAETADRLDASAIHLEWNISGKIDVILRPQILHVLRSIIREATSNVIKHAKAKTVDIEILFQDSHISCVIKDDGKGFNFLKVYSGHGLKNIRTRIESLGGHVAIESLDQTARQSRYTTSISITLPTAPSEA